MKFPQANYVYDCSKGTVNVLLTLNLYAAILSENDLAAHHEFMTCVHLHMLLCGSQCVFVGEFCRQFNQKAEWSIKIPGIKLVMKKIS